MTALAAENPDGPSRPPQPVLERCLHVLALASLVIAQPLLEVLAGHAEFFVAHQFGLGDVAFLVGSVLLLVPLPVLSLEILASLAPASVARRLHFVIISALWALLGLLVLKRIAPFVGEATLPLALLAGILLGVAYSRTEALRFVVSVLAVALVLVPVAFLTSPQIQKLTAPDRSSFADLPSVKSTAPIVFLVFDEFPATVLLDERRRINPHRYPNLAALAESSSWFSNAISVAEVSEEAVPAILTGNYPTIDQLPTLGDYPRNIFTLFGRNYDIWAQEPMSELCPPSLNQHQSTAPESFSARWSTIASDLRILYLHVLLPESYQSRLPQIDAAWRNFADQSEAPTVKKKGAFAKAVAAMKRDRRDELSLFTSKIDERARPGLHFLHSLLPHREWEFLPQGQRYNGSLYGLDKHVWRSDEYLVQLAYQRLILQVQFLDTAIGRVVDRLKETNTFDQALIVIVGDHGVSFRPSDRRRLVNETNAPDILSVPLLIKAPGQREGRILPQPVRTIDILPTLMDLLEIESPWVTDGESGFDSPGPDFHFVTKGRGDWTVDPAIHERKYETVRWKLDLFGNGEDPLDLYRIGPHSELLGQSAAALTRGHDPEWSITNTRRKWFKGVDLLESAPVFVDVSLTDDEGNPPSSFDVAFALNGTVYGTTRAHEEAPEKFSAMVPLEAFRNGDNELEVFRISQDAGSVGLIRLGPWRDAESD